MDKFEMWLAADGDEDVYVYLSKPTYDKVDKQYQGEGMTRFEPLDGKINARECLHLIPEESYDDEIHVEALDILKYFINSGRISVTDAAENAKHIKDACYNLAKEFLSNDIKHGK